MFLSVNMLKLTCFFQFQKIRHYLSSDLIIFITFFSNQNTKNLGTVIFCDLTSFSCYVKLRKNTISFLKVKNELISYFFFPRSAQVGIRALAIC